MPGAWIDTEVSFQLTSEDSQTYVLFLHSNWKERLEYMGHVVQSGPFSC